jgi:hypothetical protein
MARVAPPRFLIGVEPTRSKSNESAHLPTTSARYRRIIKAAKRGLTMDGSHFEPGVKLVLVDREPHYIRRMLTTLLALPILLASIPIADRLL